MPVSAACAYRRPNIWKIPLSTSGSQPSVPAWSLPIVMAYTCLELWPAMLVVGDKEHHELDTQGWEIKKASVGSRVILLARRRGEV